MIGQTRILVVDDEPGITDFIALGLRHEGFEVKTSPDGRAGLLAIDEFKPHLAIIDIMMPRLDGWQMCQELSGDPHRGIIILSARDETTDRVKGLELGADDYLVKPFDFSELLARINAVLRRRQPDLYQEIRAGNIVIDRQKHEVHHEGQIIDLTVREFDLLCFLAMNTGKTVSRQKILDEVWGYNFFGDENNVEVYIRYLRQKLNDSSHNIIQTVRGIGYMLRAEEFAEE